MSFLRTRLAGDLRTYALSMTKTILRLSTPSLKATALNSLRTIAYRAVLSQGLCANLDCRLGYYVYEKTYVLLYFVGDRRNRAIGAVAKPTPTTVGVGNFRMFW